MDKDIRNLCRSLTVPTSTPPRTDHCMNQTIAPNQSMQVINHCAQPTIAPNCSHLKCLKFSQSDATDQQLANTQYVRAKKSGFVGMFCRLLGVHVSPATSQSFQRRELETVTLLVTSGDKAFIYSLLGPHPPSLRRCFLPPRTHGFLQRQICPHAHKPETRELSIYTSAKTQKVNVLHQPWVTN